MVTHSLDLIAASLRPGETIRQLAVARSPLTVVALATDDRVLLLAKGGVMVSIVQWNTHQLSGKDVIEVSYENLDIVRVRRGLLPGNGELEFGGRSAMFLLRGVENDFAQAFGAYLSSRIAARQQPVDGGPADGAPKAPRPASDIPDLLRHLADLRDQGVLTEAEFESKKTELLGRI
jgi:hypothetical protein